MDPKAIRATRKLIVGTLLVFNVIMVLLWFAVPPTSGSDARLRAVLLFWVGADVVLAGAWLAGGWMLRRVPPRE